MEMLNRIDELEEENDTYTQESLIMEEERELREFKIRASSALTQKLHKESKWDEVYERMIENRDKLEAIRKGVISPTKIPGEFVTEWAVFSGVLQLSNVASATLLCLVGLWPVALVTIPSILLYNHMWLKKQKSANE